MARPEEALVDLLFCTWRGECQRVALAPHAECVQNQDVEYLCYANSEL